ncbi:MAG: hypothetical protein KGY69_14280 [Bacteroidales bacterium]|nr:hypothetical protein [Bacteroidales bacterium]
MKTKTKQEATENRINQIFGNEVLNAREMLLIKGGDANDTEDQSGGADQQEDGFC